MKKIQKETERFKLEEDEREEQEKRKNKNKKIENRIITLINVPQDIITR